MMLLMLGCPVILLHAADFVCQTTVAAEKNRRNLDIVDIFAGKCAVKEGFCHMGANGEAFEKELNPIVGDILSTRGFLRLLQQTLRGKEDSLLHAGPPCSTWVWVNRFTSGRSKEEPQGNLKQPSVAESNKITMRLVLILMIALSRCCHVLIEQPRSSLMPHFGPFISLAQHLLNKFGLEWSKTNMWMASWGAKSPKPTTLFGVAPWAYLMYRKLTKQARERLTRKLARKGHKLVKVYQDQRGQRRVQGTKALKASQVYTKRYGKQIARLHLEHIAKHPGLLRQAMMKGTVKPTAKNMQQLLRSAPHPKEWEMANLKPIQDFLKEQRDAGNYRPVIPYGLDD